jgi:hypothetical protein
MVIDFQPSGCLENFNSQEQSAANRTSSSLRYFIAGGMAILLLIYNIDSANSLYMRTFSFLKGRGRRFRTIAY